MKQVLNLSSSRFGSAVYNAMGTGSIAIALRRLCLSMLSAQTHSAFVAREDRYTPIGS
jgi:hypothetical protein